MMEGVKAYVLSVTAGAILCGLVTSLSGKKGVQKGVIRLLTGAFLIVTVIAPLAKVKIQDLQDYLGDISMQSEAVAAEGENFANAQMADIITQRTEAYILDKAASMSVALQVEVTLSEENPPVPRAVTLTGALAPYQKSTLEDFISGNLGIAKEEITWK